MNLPNLPDALINGLGKVPDEWRNDLIHVTDFACALEGNDAKCHREFWLRVHGAKKKPDSPGQKLMWDNGKRLHERAVQLMQDGLEKGWRLQWTERSVSDYLPDGVVGRADACLYGPNGEVVIVDFKTVRGRAFRFIEQGPKESWVLQVQTYCYAYDADMGMVLVIDREGQNSSRQFVVKRDDQRVKQAMSLVMEIARRIEQPEPNVSPKLTVNKNKGADSVKLELPWQCAYCSYLGVSCEGVMPQQFSGKVVGHIDGGFKPKRGCEGLKEIVEGVMEVA